MILWVSLFILLALVSIVALFLAKHSLRNYQEPPQSSLKYSLYLIRSPKSLTVKFLEELCKKIGEKETLISFERLYKGNSSALVAYAPKDLIEQFEYLNLLELEEYTEKVGVVDCLSWEIVPKKGVSQKKLYLSSPPTFLRKHNLSDKDQLYFQLVAQPFFSKKDNCYFQVSLRAVVISKDPIFRAKTAKEIDNLMVSQTNFRYKEQKRASSKIFQSYKERQIVPREVAPFVLRGEDLVSLLNQ